MKAKDYVTTERTRHGRIVYYFRRPGKLKKRIRAEPGSPEWHRILAALKEGRELPAESTQPEPRAARGTFDAILAAFQTSPEWLTALKPASRKYLLPSLRYMKKRWGGYQVAEVEPHNVKSLLRGAATGKGDPDWPADRYSASAHNAMLQALNKVFAFAEVELKLDPRNRPTFKIAKLRLESKDSTWTEAEIEQYRRYWPIGSVARLALELLYETGARGRSDAIRLGWKDIDDGGELVFTPRKTDRSTKVQVVGFNLNDLRSPYLKPCLDLVPPRQLARDLPFLLRKNGKPYNEDLFGRHIAKWAKAAGLPDHCRAHGLRHAFGCRLADDGAGHYGIGAALGDRDPKAIEVYTKKRDNAKLAREARTAYKRAVGG
jgi:integrase